MVYELLGITLALAALLTLNAVVTLAASALWRFFLARRTLRWPAAARANLVFALRALPLLTASACVVALLIPAYVIHEPRHTDEEISTTLIALAALSAVGIALAVVRGVSAWAATRRLVRDWLRHAEPVALPGVGVPAYVLRHTFPLIAVVGVFRPRLFVAAQVFDALGREELAAAIAHEAGHLRARDNLKRAALRVCRDSLSIFPSGRVLDRAWARAAEMAADECAARSGGRVALDLAAALIKIARLVPPQGRPAIPAGAYINGAGGDGVEARVRRLLQLAAARDGETRAGEFALRWVAFSSASALLAAVLVPLATPDAYEAIHAVIEHVVATL
ncbi:MAG TPA: M48 family metalloprotease [Pyrinomonadaceae bacterium]|nr:M48 family metalloprotease [Pyrinomonadaceae bacterium]